MAGKPRVTFLIAGVQKAGTTALFEHLARAGCAALSDVKETHFFDDDTRDWARPDYADYHARFPPPDGRPCGEATPIYLYWPGALERVRAYSPKMRLIVLLRDPVARAWSHWRMETARGAEREPFGWCIRQGRQRLFDSEPWGHHREFSYVERGYYGEQLERLFGLFPRDQVLVLAAERLRREPAAVLGETAAFLGVAAPADPRPLEVHVGEPAPGGARLDPEDAAFLRRLYARDQARLAELTGGAFGAS